MNNIEVNEEQVEAYRNIINAHGINFLTMNDIELDTVALAVALQREAQDWFLAAVDEVLEYMDE